MKWLVVSENARIMLSSCNPRPSGSTKGGRCCEIDSRLRIAFITMSIAVYAAVICAVAAELRPRKPTHRP
jgi:hypothetical protein